MSLENVTDKNSLFLYLQRRLVQKQAKADEYVRNQQSLNEMLVNVGNICGTKCLVDFNTQSLSSQEEMCMSSCSQSYFDAMEKGEAAFSKVVHQNFKF